MSKANKVFAYINTRSWIANISDERAQGNNIVITLKDGWFFTADPNCGVRGFDSIRDASAGCSRNTVYNPSLTKVKTPRVKAVPTAPVIETPVAKPKKELSMSKDAIRKREKRAAAKAVKA
jgi:hypothetical protein